MARKQEPDALNSAREDGFNHAAQPSSFIFPPVQAPKVMDPAADAKSRMSSATTGEDRAKAQRDYSAAMGPRIELENNRRRAKR